jgi:hypothetical protein
MLRALDLVFIILALLWVAGALVAVGWRIAG